MVFNRIVSEKQGRNEGYLIKLEIPAMEAWNARTLSTLKKWKQRALCVHLISAFALLATESDKILTLMLYWVKTLWEGKQDE